MKSRDMTVGTPSQNILLFSIPILIGNLFQQFYNLTDTIIVGRFLGQDPLAAVGSVGSIVFLVIGITIKNSVIIAQYAYYGNLFLYSRFREYHKWSSSATSFKVQQAPIWRY